MRIVEVTAKELLSIKNTVCDDIIMYKYKKEDEDILDQLFTSNMVFDVIVDKIECLSTRLLDYIRDNNRILYINMDTTEHANNLKMCNNLNCVVLCDLNCLIELSEKCASALIDNNIHLNLVENNLDIAILCKVYQKLQKKGYCGILHPLTTMIEKIHSDELNSIDSMIISKSDISSHNIYIDETIIKTRNKLIQNAKKRINRLNEFNEKDSILLTVDVIPIKYNEHLNVTRKNLGIEYIVSYVNRNGYKAETLYLNSANVVSTVSNKIRKQGSIKFVGFSCMEDNVNIIKHTIKELKKEFPTIIYFVGGAQVVALGKEFIVDSGCHFLLEGEGENTVLELLQSYTGEKRNNIKFIDGLKYINEKGEYVVNKKRELIENLDSYPFPEYVYHQDENLTLGAIITGRGCPFNCAFCFEGAKEKQVRYRSLDNVFEELYTMLKNNRNIKLIQIYDDTFTLDSNRVLEFCRRFKKLREIHNVRWVCEVHCQTVCNKPYLLKEMMNAGLSGIQIGIENGNNEILKKFNKRITNNMILEVVKKCKELSLNIEGNIILGGAGETHLQINDNYKFIEELLVAGAGVLDLSIAVFWPFPNTPIANDPGKYGVYINEQQKEFSSISMRNIVTESNEINRSQFICYYHSLVNRITELYKKICLDLTYDDLKVYWNKEKYFNGKPKWGYAASQYPHLLTYFTATTDMDEISLSKDIYPIRTFDLLEYNEFNHIKIPTTDIELDNLKSRIIELCNGKSTVDEISKILNLEYDDLAKELENLKSKMYIYFSKI